MTVITDPDDYLKLLSELSNHNGAVSYKFRFRMMQKAWRHVAEYDQAIADYTRAITP